MNQISIERIKRELLKIIEETFRIIHSEEIDLNIKNRLSEIKKTINYHSITLDVIDKLEELLEELSFNIKNQEEKHRAMIPLLNSDLKFEQRMIEYTENVFNLQIIEIKNHKRFIQDLISQEIEREIKSLSNKVQFIFTQNKIVNMESFVESNRKEIENLIKFMKTDDINYSDNNIVFYNKDILVKFKKLFSNILYSELAYLLKDIENKYNQQMTQFSKKIHQQIFIINPKINIGKINFPKLKLEIQSELLTNDIFDNIFKEHELHCCLTVHKNLLERLFQSSDMEIPHPINYKIDIFELKKNIETELQVYKKSLMSKIVTIYKNEVRNFLNEKIDLYTIKFEEYNNIEKNRLTNIYNQKIEIQNKKISSLKFSLKRNQKSIERIVLTKKILSNIGDKNV